MEEKKKGSGLATFFSVLYILAALCLLMGVLGICYPAFGQEVRHAIGGWENSSIRQAFGTLADGLEAGEPVKDVVAESFEVLTGEPG